MTQKLTRSSKAQRLLILLRLKVVKQDHSLFNNHLYCGVAGCGYLKNTIITPCRIIFYNFTSAIMLINNHYISMSFIESGEGS